MRWRRRRANARAMKKTTIMLPEDLRAWAARAAHDRGISFGELVRDALEEKRRPAGDDDDLFEPVPLPPGVKLEHLPTDASENHEF